MTSPDANAHAARFAALPTLPRDGNEPVFAEPWQAQAFALAIKLSEQGWFSWSEWAATLAVEIKHGVAPAEPDYGSMYYRSWLAALERLVTSKRLSDPESLRARKEAWADAYRLTPHGKPVTLGGGGGRTPHGR